MSPSSDSLRQPPETEAAERAKWLRDEIKRHNSLYHKLDAQEIKDEKYDELFSRTSRFRKRASCTGNVRFAYSVNRRPLQQRILPCETQRAHAFA